MNSPCVLTLVMAPELGGPFDDWFLEIYPDVGFTRAPVAGHSSQHEGLTLHEQVIGHRVRTQVQIVCERSTGQDVVEQLRSEFPGANVHYWLVEVAEAGHLGEP